MARKRLNKNVVVAISLLGFAMIFALCVVMLRNLQQRDPKHFVEIAQRAEASEQWKQAALFYNEAWERSDDPSHLVRVGDMLLREGEIGLAIAQWRKALIHKPDFIDAHRRQVDLLLQAAKSQGSAEGWQPTADAAGAMLVAVEGKSKADQAFAQHAHGLALLNLEGRGEESERRGLEELRSAVSLAPETVEYATDLATQLAKMEKLDEAEGIFRELEERHAAPGADASKVRLSHAQYLAGRGRGDEADGVFRQALELSGESKEAGAEARLAYAGFLGQRWLRANRDPALKETAPGFYAQAENILKEEIQRDPAGYDAYLQLAFLYKLAARHKEVAAICEERLSKGLTRVGLEAAKNRLSAFTLMIYASEAWVAEAIQAHQRGDVNARQEAFKRAEQLVADARGEAPNHPRILSQLGRLKMAQGLDREALRHLQEADAAYQNQGSVNWENKILLSTLHLKLNEAGAARATLENVLDRAQRSLASEPTFWNAYAQTLLQTQDYDRALGIVDAVLGFDPENVNARQIKAAIFERQGKHAQAGILHEAATGSGGIRAMLDARALMLEGDVEGAIKVLTSALEKDPSDVRLVSATVQELVNRKRFKEAAAITQKAIAANPQERAFQQIALLTREDLSEVARDAALREMIAAEPDELKKSLDFLVLHLRRNEAREALAQIEIAERHFLAKETPSARNSTSAQHHALLRTKLRVAGQLQDDAAMQAARDSGARHNVDGAEGKSILGLYYMQRRDWELAMSALREALLLQPTDALSLTALGQCLLAVNRHDEAEEVLQRAVKINPNEGDAHQNLAYLAQARGDNATFEKELAEAQRIHPTDPWVEEQVAMQAEQRDPAGAIQRREAQLAQRPDDPKILQRLAWLYEVTNAKEKADPAYAKLLEIEGIDSKSVLAAVGYYRRTGRGQTAIDLLQKMALKAQTPADKSSAQLSLAGEYIQQRNFEQAEKVLLEAAEKNPDVQVLHGLAQFYLKHAVQPEKALPWLDKAVQMARDSKDSKLAFLLDTRIGCLLSREIGNVERARADIEELQQRYPDFARGHLWNSELSARSGDTLGAITALDEYLKTRANDAYALFQRARHRIAQGQTTPAIEDLLAIKRVSPLALQLEPRFLLVRLYRELGRNEQAVSELESVVKDAPTSYPAAERQVSMYLELRRFEDADRLVTAQINRGGADVDPRWYFLRGRVSIAVNQGGKALEDFRKGAEVANFSPGAIAQVLDLLGKSGKSADGVKYFEQYGDPQTATSQVLARYAGLLARNEQKSVAVEQFRKAMVKALGEGPEAVRAVTDEIQGSMPVEAAIELFRGTQVAGGMEPANDRILIRLHTAAKQFDQALEMVGAAIARAANDADRAALQAEKGDIHQNAQQWDEAIAAYQESLKHDARNWVTLNNVAYLLSDRRSDNQGALGFALRAAGIADNHFTLDTLGWIYVGLQREVQAVAELSRAIRLNPDYALSYYHLGEARRRLGQMADAEAVLKSGKTLALESKDAELAQLIDQSLDRIRNGDRSSVATKP